MKRLATDKSKSGNAINVNVRCSKTCPKGATAFMHNKFLSEEMILCAPFWELQSTAYV